MNTARQDFETTCSTACKINPGYTYLIYLFLFLCHKDYFSWYYELW